MGTGARFASKCYYLIYHFISLTTIVRRSDASVKRTACFLTGSSSSLRMHIARNHVDIYRKRCTAREIKMVSRVLTGALSDANMDG